LVVRAAIEEIVADAIANFHSDMFWPAHPSDDGGVDGNPSVYWGAAGVIWALDYLRRIDATRAAKDFRPVLPKLLERTVTAFESNSPTDYAKHGSLHFGDMGAALVAMRRLWPISCTGAQRQISTCRSGSSCGACRGR
jgi:hypothetical protein